MLKPRLTREEREEQSLMLCGVIINSLTAVALSIHILLASGVKSAELKATEEIIEEAIKREESQARANKKAVLFGEKQKPTNSLISTNSI